MGPTTTVNHWEALGLEPGADGDALKQAFRRQARRWHPDLNGNDPAAEERFKRINEAYAVLSDPRRRQAWEGGSEFSQQDPFASGFPDFNQYLEHLFGSKRSRPSPPPAEWPTPSPPPPPPPVQARGDQETLVQLSPQQALEGSSVQVQLEGGVTVEVETPPEAGDGWRLRLAGVAPGGADHFLQLQVRTADDLRIDGLRVLYRLDLPAPEGALGVDAVVPTLEGPVRLKIPPGTSSGRLLRLRGRGLERQGRRGDQIVEVRLVVPEACSEAEQALYRRLLDLLRE
jgi:DnaJ-class molecular chaperone